MESAHSESSLAAGIDSLHVTGNNVLDPWYDAAPPSASHGKTEVDVDKAGPGERLNVLHTPDPSVLDETVVGGLGVEAASEPIIQTQSLPDVLNEFDPSRASSTVTHELTIPQQTRFLVSIELGRVERHVSEFLGKAQLTC
jgi:hypothetical protein